MMFSEPEWPPPARRAAEALRRLVEADEVGGGLEAGSIRVGAAPGRVNLLGGHTDYNEGYVLPVAVNRYVACAVLETVPEGGGEDDASSLEFYGLDFDDRFTIELTRLGDLRADGEAFERLVGGQQCRWRRYVAGVVLEMDEAGMALPASQAVITGDVPIGSGLSSSAALEAAVYTALAPAGPATVEAALLCQRAENRWAGVPCGIMDQFASFMAQEGRVLFLDCRRLTYKNVRLPGGSAITVVDSGIRRELADGEYRKRRREIETALGILRKVVGPLQSLRDLTPEVFAEVEDMLPLRLRRRVEHVVGAIARVPRGITHLALGEDGEFGKLLNECHRSLADLYDVSTAELDTIVSAASEVEGVLGARLTGAGFGGCCVVLHREGCEDELRSAVTAAFEAKFSPTLSFYHLHTASGARLLGGKETVQ